MKKALLLLILFTTPFLGKASHIVGGEFELIHLKDFKYRLNLVLYFDVLNGSPGAKDQQAAVRIFRMIDNVGMMDVTLPLVSESNVDYTQPECSNGELVTSRILYSLDITLSPEKFSDPGGYYVAWERCCRNYSISNIFSDPPGSGVTFAGQTFYLEFPPVMKDGQPFVDSTPRLFPPLNDFACPRRPYYTDFGGTDDDGDSLVYSMVAPLNTKSADALPIGGTRPRPYPDVRWRAPYSMNNIMGGAPDIRVSRDGFLTVTPTLQGLFVFAVKVEEYRDKVKIGETRRDFQMLVVDACPRAVPPQILGKKLSDASFTYNNSMSIFFANTVVDGQRCIQVQVSDPDSQSADDNFQERVRIKAIPLNFKKDLSGILPTVTNATLMNGSTAEFTICFPACPYFAGGAYEVGIVAMDDACSLPLSDTLKVAVLVDPPPNNKPRFTSTNPVTSTLNEGQQGAWPFSVVDDDGDPLIVSVLTNGFVLANAGMTFNIINQVPGAANGEIKWDAYCNIYDFTKRTGFQVKVQVEDQDRCLLPDPAKAIYNLNVILPGNADPVIDTDLTPATAERSVKGLTRRINESLRFKVTGKDLTDNDFLVLSGRGKDFNMADYGIAVSPLPVSGTGTTSSDLQWDITCTTTDLKVKDTFDFQFIVVDNANKCRLYKADTVDVEVKILPPANQPPVLSVANGTTATAALQNNTISMILGSSIDFQLTGTDADAVPVKDNLKLALVSQTGSVEPKGYTFAPASGQSPVTSSFRWTPDCSIFEGGVYENEYTLVFRLDDDHCLTAKKDSVTVTIKVKDVDGTDKEFIPPNFFSPNGDGVNDYFAMESKDPVTDEVHNILPNDNCLSQFQSVHVYNRWGNTVFQSADRNFKWTGSGESAGVYYYSLSFSKKEYKGSVSLRY